MPTWHLQWGPCPAERTACVAVWHAQSPHTGTSENMEHSEMPDKNSRSVILTGLDVETRGVEKVQSVLWKLEGTIQVLVLADVT